MEMIKMLDLNLLYIWTLLLFEGGESVFQNHNFFLFFWAYRFLKIFLIRWFAYSGDLFIGTHLFPVDISGLMSFQDYWIAH